MELKCTSTQEQESQNPNENRSINNTASLTNLVRISGIIQEEPTFDHEVFGEGFFSMIVKVTRQSGTVDNVPVIVSERLLPVSSLKGRNILVEGQVRTYNKFDMNGRGHLYVRVFAKNFVYDDERTNVNEVELCGYICKPPTYRFTPFGREITDLMVAVNRAYGKSDYIPCIAWGRAAKYTAALQVGTCIKIVGRFQSREYQNLAGESREIHEVSASRVEAY